ncbi:hypothetical protein NBRC116188_28440 [Oceaniserpentilla sp. 4NH20-0058]|uniref:SGNH/GDSL hydrolase family protein n=1 Tax=Oceaniserpentilla sp. 4NH20-0058 TaxID=3127660 RepID=UPI00310BA13E
MLSLKNVMLAAFSFALVSGANAIGGGGGGSNGPSKMIVGDSIFALSGDIHSYLEDDLNEEIDTHARSGCQMLGGNLICSSYYRIPRQYDRASKTGIDTVIFNGGGNDFLLGDGGDCSTSACVSGVLADVEEAIAGMVSDMQDDGMDQIIFLGYYYTEDENNNAINLESANYKAANYPAMGIDFIDTRASFQGNEWRYISSDGIHPTAAGSRVLADLIKAELN